MNAMTEGAGLRLAPTVTKLTDQDRDRVVVCGSHGGRYSAYCAAKAGVRAIILNDAGVGKDAAGIAGLDDLDGLGLAAATVSCHSARIGDPEDMLARGRISHVNAAARALGCAPGQDCAVAARALAAATAPQRAPAPYAEARLLVREAPGGLKVWCIDSAAMVTPELDEGMICILGSHGGLMKTGNPRSALQVDARAAVFHDAGVGIDGAGVTRLPELDTRGIAAATVAGETARIGDARSVFEDGVLSHVNQAAAALGAVPGERTSDFVDRVLAAMETAKTGR